MQVIFRVSEKKYLFQTILPRGTIFCFYGWKYVAFLVAGHCYAMTLNAAVYIALAELSTAHKVSNKALEIRNTDEYSYINVKCSPPLFSQDVPSIIDWVRQKAAFIIIDVDRIRISAVICKNRMIIIILMLRSDILASGVGFLSLLAFFIFQAVIEIKNGMLMTSPATKR